MSLPPIDAEPSRPLDIPKGNLRRAPLGWFTPDLLLAAGLYAITAIAVTWPAILSLRQVLLGHPGNDVWNHVWGFWWVGSEILDSGRWPGFTNLIAFPKGGMLYYIDTFNALWTLPVLALGGPVLTHNVVFLGSLWFSAFAAWLLARHVVRDDRAALVAGMVYGFCPHILAQAYDGITESLNIGWLAIYVLCLLRLVERPDLRRGMAAGLTLVICGLFNWYYGLFAGLATVVITANAILRKGAPLAWRPLLRWGIPGGLLFVPLAIGGLWLLWRTMDAPDALVTRDPSFVWSSLLYHNITDLQGFFRPGRFYSPDLKALYGEELIIVTYLGWITLGLAVWASLQRRRPRDLAPWLVLGLMCWIFSLGPYLNVLGKYVEVAGHRLPLPFLAFFEALPLFSRISHPFRFVVGVEMALGILAAFALVRPLRGVSPARARLLGCFAALAVILETWLASPAILPLPSSAAVQPEAYRILREDPLPGAVLDLPIAVPILERAVYNWYQIDHGRPIPYTLNEPLPPGLRNNQLAWFLLDLEAGRARLLPRTLPDLELVVSSRILARQGYRYVVVHDLLYPEVKRTQVHTVLDALLGSPLVEAEQGITIYKFP